MATVPVVTTPLLDQTSSLLFRFTWTPMANGDVGAPIKLATFCDRSIQIYGTFGVGGTVAIEGSNDGGATFSQLTDPQGNPLQLTSASIREITEVVEYVRPRVTGGDGTTSLGAYMVARSAAFK